MRFHDNLNTEALAGLPAPTQSSLLDLAPLHLPTRWEGRYTADEERKSLNDFAKSDRKSLVEVYQLLLGLFLSLRPHYAEVGPSAAVVADFVNSDQDRRLQAAMENFGEATRSGGKEFDRVVHDLRGGALQALSFQLELFRDAPRETAVQRIFFLVRDHLKIMRNMVHDLDRERFEADCARKAHDAELLVEKWSQIEFHAARRRVRILLDCRYTGGLCESCLEFSTLDRVIYNLMNNAAEHSADGVVHFSVLPIPGESPESVRFVVCNSVDAAQRQTLSEQFGDDLGEIFRGGFTTQGHGVGLRICADFCAHAYGLSDFDRAKEEGYFGCTWIDDRFTVWFHWPIGH